MSMHEYEYRTGLFALLFILIVNNLSTTTPTVSQTQQPVRAPCRDITSSASSTPPHALLVPSCCQENYILFLITQYYFLLLLFESLLNDY